jgi:hypothetical protein
MILFLLGILRPNLPSLLILKTLSLRKTSVRPDPKDISISFGKIYLYLVYCNKSNDKHKNEIYSKYFLKNYKKILGSLDDMFLLFTDQQMCCLDSIIRNLSLL